MPDDRIVHIVDDDETERGRRTRRNAQKKRRFCNVEARCNDRSSGKY
jgi:hypothetical protein